MWGRKKLKCILAPLRHLLHLLAISLATHYHLLRLLLAVWVQSLCLYLFLHSRAHDHSISVHVVDYGLWVAHIGHILRLDHTSHIVGESTHATHHVLVLHPLWVDLSALGLTLLTGLKYGLVLVKGLPAVAMVPTCEPCAVIAAIRSLEALSVTIGVMVMARVLALTLKVLGSD